MNARVVGLFAAAVVLTACSESGSKQEATTSDRASAPASEASGKTASVEQWASLIAKHLPDTADVASKLEDNVCASTVEDPTCDAYYVTAGVQAETFTIEVDVASDPDNPTFIGEPPTEIANLLEDTLDAAQDVVKAHEAWTAGCQNSPSEDACITLRFDLSMAVDNLSSQFDAWAPYL